MKQIVIKSRSAFVMVMFILISSACGTLSPEKNGTTPPDHSGFTSILNQYVDSLGKVNYQGLLQDSIRLKAYLLELELHPPDELVWSNEEQLAFWINAYNAYTLLLMIRNYPVKSIKDIGGSWQVPFVNTPWDIRFIHIAGQTLDLNNIEHNILRKKWSEPRIHFAINCASKSCPQLRQEAFTAQDLENQLTDQAQRFLRDTTKNLISINEIRLSRIFLWYRGDFTQSGSLIEYVNQYAELKTESSAVIEYLEYDWSLNE